MCVKTAYAKFVTMYNMEGKLVTMLQLTLSLFQLHAVASYTCTHPSHIHACVHIHTHTHTHTHTHACTYTHTLIV